MKFPALLLVMTAILALPRRSSAAKTPAAQSPSAQSPVVTEDIDYQAEPAPAANPAPAPKPAAPAPAPAAPPPAAPPPAASVEEVSVPAEAVSASSAPAAAPQPPAAAPAAAAPAVAASTTTRPSAAVPPPAAAPSTSAAATQNAPNCATHTRALGKLYDDLAVESRAFYHQSEDQVSALKQEEAEIQVRLDAAKKEYSDKSKDPAVIRKTSWWGGNQELSELKTVVRQVTKELNTAHDDTSRRSDAVITDMEALEKRQLAAIKAKFESVEKLVEAAKDK